jgi:nucleotide-binding universal stress UspA family protein
MANDTTDKKSELAQSNNIDPEIVVGVDGSPGAGRALEYAVHEAAKWGVPLRVVNAYGVRTAVPDPEESVDPDSCSIVREAIDLANILEPSVETVGVSSRGSAGDVLYEESAFSNLLVVGSRGQGGKCLVSGDIRDYCVHHVLCPVTVVP